MQNSSVASRISTLWPISQAILAYTAKKITTKWSFEPCIMIRAVETHF